MTDTLIKHLLEEVDGQNIQTMLFDSHCIIMILTNMRHL